MLHALIVLLFLMLTSALTFAITGQDLFYVSYMVAAFGVGIIVLVMLLIVVTGVERPK